MFVSFILFLLFAGAALACPMCKEAVQDPKLTQGFARSIKLMLLAPYVVFGGLAFAIVRSARRKKS